MLTFMWTFTYTLSQTLADVYVWVYSLFSCALIVFKHTHTHTEHDKKEMIPTTRRWSYSLASFSVDKKSIEHNLKSYYDKRKNN